MLFSRNKRLKGADFMAGSYRKRGEKYLLEYMYNGKRYSKTIACSDKEIKEELMRFIISIKDKVSPTSSITLVSYSQKWLNEYAKIKLRERTIQLYKDYLNGRILPHFGNIKLKDIKAYNIQMFLNSLTSELSTASIKKYKALLSVMLNTAVKWQIIEFNPCVYVDIPLGLNNKVKPIFLTKNEANELLNCLKNEDLKYQVIVRLALQCGMRRSEILGLTWNDIDFYNNTININKALSYIKGQGQIITNTKNKSSNRIIYANSELIKLIQALPHKSEYIFNKEHIDDVTKWFNRFLKRHNLKHMRFHDLRHTHATLLISSGVNMKTVSTRLGHSSINTTLNIYTHSLNEDDKKASEII